MSILDLMSSYLKLFTIWSMVLFVATIKVSATETPITEPDKSPIILKEILFEIDGNSKESALSKNLFLKEGMGFNSEEELIGALDEQLQDLLNLHYYKDSLKYTLSKIDENRYSVSFFLEDAWTFIPIAYPVYDTNNGLSIGSQVFWDNIFGSMMDIYFNSGVSLVQKGSKFDINDWSILLSLSRIRLSQSLYLTIDLYQSLEKELFVDNLDTTKSFDYSYYLTSLTASTRFSLPFQLRYLIGLRTTFRYLYGGNIGPNIERRFEGTAFHSLGWGYVDWTPDRQRKGYYLSLNNSHSFGGGNNEYYIVNFALAASGYYPFLKRFYVMGRVYTFYQYGELLSFGSYVRGVPDKNLAGVWGMAINSSLSFTFWRFENVFHAQMQPYVDIGFAYNGESFQPARDFHVGAGIDFVLYLDALPGLVARGGIGFDVLNINKDSLFDNLEISISSNLHF